MRAIRLLTAAAVAVCLLLPAAAVAAPPGPAIAPPDVSHQVVTLRGSGGRGAAFMDYTDDACAFCFTAQLQGLTPGARYRLVGSPQACAATYDKATRVFSATFRASSRGTWWAPRASVTRHGSAPAVAIRVLKGATGTQQVACGTAVDLTTEDGHPLVDRIALVSRFTGSDRRGLLFAIGDAEGFVDVTAAFQDVPGAGPLRARGVSAPCTTPMGSATTVLRLPALDVTARHTAFASGIVALESGAKPGDLDTFRLGRASSPFSQVRCQDTTLFGVIDV